MVATERPLLEEILKRRADAAASRLALPPELPAWQFVDASAAVWAVLAKPAASDGAEAPAARQILTFEHHVGNDARFVLRCPPESLPDVDPAQIDPYANDPTYGAPKSTLRALWQAKIAYTIDRPADGPAHLTIPLANLDRGKAAEAQINLMFVAGALFQYCLPPH